MRLERTLKWHWVVTPGIGVSNVVVVIAVLFAPQVLSFGNVLGTFVAFAVLIGLSLSTLAFVNARQRMRKLLEVVPVEGQNPPAVLEEAARQVAAEPTAQLKQTVRDWLLGGVAIALADLFVGTKDFDLALRLFGLAAFFAPTTGLMAYVLTLHQSRRTLSAIEHLGLGSERLAHVIPQRYGLVKMLAAFTLITALTPVALTTFLLTSNARASLVEVVELETQNARIAAAHDIRDAMVLKGLAVCAVMAMLAWSVALLGGNFLSAPIRGMGEVATLLAAGKLAKPRCVPAEGEIWLVSMAFTRMHVQLNALLGQLKVASSRIGATSSQIVSSSERFEMTAAQQSAALNETTATTEELARSAAQIAENAALVALRAEQTSLAAQEGQTHAEAFTRTMARMREDNRSADNAVTRLSKRVAQIGRIVVFINSVADKSDLLALSAELEGIKAGDVGRGFGLVASEMRRLAENIIESTREIEDLIREIREATVAAAAATEAGVRATEDGARHGGEVSEGLSTIVSFANQTTVAAQGISSATQNQQQSTDELARGMARILQLTAGNFRGSREAVAKNADLALVAAELQAIVDRFEAKEA